MTGRGLYSEQRLRYNFIIWLKRSIKMSDYITTYTGNHIDPADPDPEAISIRYIAHALSLICRGNGHVRNFWSVGQHCLDCAHEAQARKLSPRMILACLLHDGGNQRTKGNRRCPFVARSGDAPGGDAAWTDAGSAHQNRLFIPAVQGRGTGLPGAVLSVLRQVERSMGCKN